MIFTLQYVALSHMLSLLLTACTFTDSSMTVAIGILAGGWMTLQTNRRVRWNMLIHRLACSSTHARAHIHTLVSVSYSKCNCSLELLTTGCTYSEEADAPAISASSAATASASVSTTWRRSAMERVLSSACSCETRGARCLRIASSFFCSKV